MLLLFFCQLICANGLYVVVYDRISRTNIRLVRKCWPPSVEFNKYTFLWMEATSVQSDQPLLLCRSYPTNCTHAHAHTYTQTFSLFVCAFFFACLSPECVNIYHPNNSILSNCLIFLNNHQLTVTALLIWNVFTKKLHILVRFIDYQLN